MQNDTDQNITDIKNMILILVNSLKKDLMMLEHEHNNMAIKNKKSLLQMLHQLANLIQHLHNLNNSEKIEKNNFSSEEDQKIIEDFIKKMKQS